MRSSQPELDGTFRNSGSELSMLQEHVEVVRKVREDPGPQSRASD